MMGGSGASAQVSYPLTHYGADAYLDAILPVSGPTHAVMAKTCRRVREEVDSWGSAGNDLDSAYGYTNDTGPCAQHDPTWAPLWDRDSVATQGSDYQYPSTRVHLILGKLDHVQVMNAGDFARRLAAAGSPFVSMHVVPGMQHALNADGYLALEDALIWDASHGMAACDNGLDDDEDGFVDFAGSDPGCTTPTDLSERRPGGPACDDDVDQDGDGKVDYPDEVNGCSDPLDIDERAAGEPCDNGLDDDGDGAPDFPDDLGCVNPNDAEPPQGAAEHQAGYPCDDGLDNDGDANADFPADPDCASAVADGEGVVTPRPSLSVASVSSNEATGGNSLGVLSLTLSAIPQREVRVNFAIGGGSATAGTDYVVRTGTVVWDPQTLAVQRLAVVLIGDAATEADETVSVTLSAPVNATLATASATLTILDDDEASAMTIAAGNGTARETDPGQTSARCDVKATLSSTPAASVSVKYATAPGTAAAGTDYTSRSGSVNWQAGATKLAKVISISLVADDVVEGTEAFYVDLFSPNPSNVGISPSRATCTITDDDGASGPSIAAVSASTTEADPGQTTARCNLKATLSAKPTTTVTVSYATTSAGATAVAGTDYTPKSGTLSWPAGATNLSKTVAVPVLSDTVAEGTETFFLDLSNPSPSTWTISPSRATCTITDDD
jgi:hypothetical protein